MKNKIAAIVFAALAGAANLSAADLTMWYQQPAANNQPMNEALPIGNGRMGALVFGQPERERISVNEDSLWTGGENPSGNDNTMGAYQVLGNVFVNLPAHTNVSDYRRDLDLADSLSHVSYTVNGVKFQRELFCSHPAEILAAQFTADKKAAYTGSIELVDSHNAKIVAAGNRLTASGTLNNGMKFEWQLLVLNQGGSVSLVTDTNAARLEFKNCDSLTLLIAAGTDYVFDYAKNYHGEDPHAQVTAQMDAAAKKSFPELIAEHIKDYQAMFNRVSADFGKSNAAQTALPTDQRKLEAFKTVDPGLEALLFQYGRYLLISCSRPGGLPANLQGLWNDNNSPPWHSDYHANINVQMNYWPAEVANLAECHTPFFDLIASQLPAWRKATAAAKEFKTADGNFAKRGFAIRTSHNITGGLGWKWDKTANAWYCQHLWEHYAFGLDKNYLRTTAYPILKETCEFWEDHLKALPDGKLVVPNAWSPEHGPDEDGVTYSQEIVWDLFNNYVQAADALDADKDYRDKIAAMRDRLVTPGVGSWGQLMEWMIEKKGTNVIAKSLELDTPNDHHRHTSHLFAVYPGTQISAGKTPELAAAAKVSLNARGIDPGSDVREWSFAWRTALYARLRDAGNAHKMLQQLFSARNTCANLFGLHPPMQIDGNFGVTAGIAEMLMQSQAGEIELLPALPIEWPNGKISGLRARGGYEMNLSWQNGKLVSVTVKNISGGGKCKVRYGDKVVEFTLKPGGTKSLDGELR
ncbi:MAG TPA: glycoside hydrolase family 95 protein [Candidatus Limnocylindrales bacterium]|nr:glycoside hydrolase family 95 protein [Candidatus Limnocylindrales bacterium]